MFGMGFTEILFISGLALILIGPKQLPEVARTLGRFLNELRRSTNVMKEEFKSQIEIDRKIFEENEHKKMMQSENVAHHETPDKKEEPKS